MTIDELHSNMFTWDELAEAYISHTKQIDELELARRVADAAVAEQITGHACERVRRIFPLDHDAKSELEISNNVARVALEKAVREYRARVEAAAIMAQPAVRRGLDGVGEMEEG